MLGIGMQEILIILLVALIVIGPKRLPDLARILGKGMAEFRKAADDLQETVRRDLEHEKHDESHSRHPNLVPNDDQVDGSDPDTGAGERGSTGPPNDPPVQQVTPEPAPAAPSIPSSPSEEVEGDQNTKDDTRDG